jgi:hypothetical protein
LIREKISKLKTSLSAYQTPASIVHLSYSSERLNQAYQAGLSELASATSGSAVFCRSVPEIPSAIARMMETLVSQYVLDVQLPKGTSGKVAVAVTARGRDIPHRTHYVIR